jgi:hypothetical protein
MDTLMIVCGGAGLLVGLGVTGALLLNKAIRNVQEILGILEGKISDLHNRVTDLENRFPRL